MSGNGDVSGNLLRSSLLRTAGFFAFWLILFGRNPVASVVGTLAAVIATWTSLRLLPPARWNFRPIALMQLILSFLRQSIGAGIDIAWRALDPRLPLRPGFVIYRPHLPPGPTRNAFRTMTSLLPGTLPCGTDQSGNLVIHCLDTSQDVPEELAAQEAALIQALGGGTRDG
jgi:multicomponent Na+:H+ antiporter subunit E